MTFNYKILDKDYIVKEKKTLLTSVALDLIAFTYELTSTKEDFLEIFGQTRHRKPFIANAILRQINSEFFNDKKFILSLLKMGANVYPVLPQFSPLRADIDIINKAILTFTNYLLIPDDFKDTTEKKINLLKINSEIFNCFSFDDRNSKQLCAVLAENIANLYLIPKETISDKEFLFSLINNKKIGFSYLSFVDNKTQIDKDLLYATINKKNLAGINVLMLLKNNATILLDKKIATAILSYDGKLLTHMPLTISSNYDCIIAAIRSYPEIYVSLSKENKLNPFILREVYNNKKNTSFHIFNSIPEEMHKILKNCRDVKTTKTELNIVCERIILEQKLLNNEFLTNADKIKLKTKTLRI